MNYLDFQVVSQSNSIPSIDQFQSWIDVVLSDESIDSEIVVRIIDEAEMTQFNEQYRDKIGPTNILSFPFDVPEGIASILLGDLLVCAPIIEKESLQQNKIIDHHWAHIIVHGVLHLLGHDHIDECDAKEMEALEIKILRKIKIKNPYEEKSTL
ncbi:MAG: rRNA maturation RNase YbeY [Methylococcaceae bacterium]|nr:rRNA maturation RNase YbeY [Methylococcaceae bacterium]